MYSEVNPREKFIKTIRGENLDIPIFCPAIYDYKVNFSNSRLNLFGQSRDEFIEAVDKEVEFLRSEVVTCGYDIYNIEAEAVGSVVDRNNGDIFPDVTLSMINNLSEIHTLPEINELRGRMPLMIDITKHIHKKYHEKVYIRGAVSGPFSLAGRLYNKENLILDCMINAIGVYDILNYCTEVIITYINGYLDEGLDVVVFDSLAAPPLISPEIYRDLVRPFHQKIFQYLSNRGVQIRPLIMGGNTLPIIGYLSKSGANQLLLDYKIPIQDTKIILEQSDLAYRVNIDPAIIANHDPGYIGERLRQILGELGHYPNLLLGTGILMPNTPLENIQFVRNFIEEHYQAFFGK